MPRASFRDHRGAPRGRPEDLSYAGTHKGCPYAASVVRDLQPSFLARVGERLRLEDAQPADLLRIVEVVIGLEPHRVNAVDGADVVHLVDVAGHPDGAHDFARIVANEL